MNKDAKIRAIKRITAELVRLGGRLAFAGSLDAMECEAVTEHCRKRIRHCRARLEAML